MCSDTTPPSSMPVDQVAQVRIRCYRDGLECEVVVAVRGKEMILKCPDYEQAVKWARIECRSRCGAGLEGPHLCFQKFGLVTSFGPLVGHTHQRSEPPRLDLFCAVKRELE
jgi:hypothetical protein